MSPNILFLVLICMNQGLSEEVLSTTEEYFNCDDKTTCSTPEILSSTDSSVVLSTTDTNNSTNETNLIENDNKTLNIITVHNEHKICFCDEENNYCDINCCCDKDCSDEQKLIFSSCATGLPNTYDSRFCYSNDYIYVNNTPTLIEVINNELFCVLSTNLPPSYLIQLSQPIENVVESKKLISKNYLWSDFQYRQQKAFNISQILKHGDNIWVHNKKSSKIDKLRLPISFVTNVCIRKREVKFLENIKSSCSHMINEDISPFLIPETYYDFGFITFNSSLNFTNIDILKGCPKNICLPIKISLCDENFLSCNQVQKNDTRLNQFCQFSLYNNEQTCTQIVKKVKYTIYHNGTGGLSEIILSLNLTNATFYISNENEQFEQYFEVNFLWYDHKKNLSNLFSGNPGYDIGKPILIANVNCTTYNQTNEETTFEFVKNNSDVQHNFFVLPKNINGYCELSNERYNSINFGYNIRQSCKENILLKNTTIFSKVCNDIQKKIFNLWKMSTDNLTSDRYVGVFGNSNRYKIGEWIQIKYNFDMNETIDKISSFYNNRSEISCYNLVNKIKINILYSNVDLQTAKNQKKILSVFLELGTNDFKFIFEDKENISFDIKIYSEVRFFDVTAPKLKKFVEPPYLDVKLPRDFFYPFMSSAISFNKNNMLILSLLIIYFLTVFVFL